MTTHTNGQICYGVIISTEDDEGEIVFPWDKYEDGYGIEDWWIYDVLGFKHSFEIYDASGDYIDGVEPPNEKITQWYNERREFEKIAPPLPVTLVNYCSNDYPLYILAIPDTAKVACRGFPEVFNPEGLRVGPERQSLLDFCHEHGIKYQGEPQWYLSSYWG